MPDLFAQRLPLGEAPGVRLLVAQASNNLDFSNNLLDHAARKGIEPLKYLRKAHNFNKKGAIRVPKTGYRSDSSAVYRKSNEYLIVRPDQYGTEKIITYGVNDD